jgi:phage gpG-like protein
MQIRIHVYDNLTPSLTAVAAQLKNTRPLMAALGQELRNAHAEHFVGRGSQFWADFADATILSHIDDTSAEITVGGSYGPILWHKITGGWIRPKKGKYLAIPARAEARQLGWPSHWSQPGDGKLRPVFGRGRKLIGLALAEDYGHAGRKQRFNFKRAREGAALRSRGAWGTGLMMYWLKEQVHQQPDPQALPPGPEVEARIDARAQAHLARTLKSGG